MKRYTFVLPSENRLLSICANAVYNVIQSLKDTDLVDQNFLQRYTQETLKYVDEFSELKK